MLRLAADVGLPGKDAVDILDKTKTISRQRGNPQKRSHSRRNRLQRRRRPRRQSFFCSEAPFRTIRALRTTKRPPMRLRFSSLK